MMMKKKIRLHENQVSSSSSPFFVLLSLIGVRLLSLFLVVLVVMHLLGKTWKKKKKEKKQGLARSQ